MKSATQWRPYLQRVFQKHLNENRKNMCSWRAPNVLKCWQMFSRTPSSPFINSSRNKCSSKAPKCSQVLTNVFPNTYTTIYIQLKKGLFLHNTKMFGSVRQNFSQTLTLRIINSISRIVFVEHQSVLDCS